MMLSARSGLRPQDPLKPSLTTKWESDATTHTIESNYLETYPLFTLSNDNLIVLKLFIETPETFCNPYSKGPEPIFFWYMGGGAGRHVAGITRVKNLKTMKSLTELHPYWYDHIIFPRKWFWLPNNTRWINLT